MDHTERRRRILMVAGLMAGCLMLATAAILVGGVFPGTQLTMASLPDRGHHPGSARREPGVIESKLARYRVPVTRPVQSTPPPADPVPTRRAKRTAPATPDATRATGTPRPQASPTQSASPTPQPNRTAIATLQPALPEAAMGRTQPPRSIPSDRITPPRKTKKPWPNRHPQR
ncbi:hypothetical protein AB0L53_39295 [Nonomuraea sp. NPDC052129]|uniref:hypothetical protein n=1 Tax=Nonomuraea sp. NPDC052129 TaxID=3154651 RepID=UPI00343A852C